MDQNGNFGMLLVGDYITDKRKLIDKPLIRIKVTDNE